MSLEIKNVTKYYGAQAALKQVSFSVKPGEIVGFLGPNGAGKSTMMKIITCYIPPSEGQVQVAGYDTYSDSLAVRRKVGYLPENNPLYPEMYIREYLYFVAGIYGVGKVKQRVEEMIQTVGLTPESHKKIGALSKGYRQRVGLAQALIHDPEVLILDEPTSGLDPNQLEDIRALIKRTGQQKTVLLSTHIMQEVESMCSRAIIIKLGEIVADGPVSTLSEPRDTEVVLLHLSGNVDARLLQNLRCVHAVKPVGGGKYLLETTRDAGVGNALLQLANGQGWTVEEMRRERSSLEEVFKKLTR